MERALDTFDLLLLLLLLPLSGVSPRSLFTTPSIIFCNDPFLFDVSLPRGELLLQLLLLLLLPPVSCPRPIFGVRNAADVSTLLSLFSRVFLRLPLFELGLEPPPLSSNVVACGSAPNVAVMSWMNGWDRTGRRRRLRDSKTPPSSSSSL